MREDVRKLMRVAGWKDGSYVEVAVEQGAAEAAVAWPLLATVNSRLKAAAAIDPSTAPEGER